MSSCFLCYSGFTLKILFCRREGSRFLVECSRHSGRSFDLYFTKIISYTSVSRPVLIKEGRILRCSKTSLILSSSDKWSMFSNFCVLAFYHREAHREKSHLWCLVLSQAKESASYPVEATVSGCGSWGDEGDAGLVVGLADLESLLQPWWFCEMLEIWCSALK